MQTEIFITPRPFRGRKQKSSTLAEENIEQVIAQRIAEEERSITSSMQETLEVTSQTTQQSIRSLSLKDAVVLSDSVIESHALRVMRASTAAHKRLVKESDDGIDGKDELIDAKAINRLVILIERKRKLLKAATDGDMELYDSLNKANDDDADFMNYVYRPTPKAQWNLKTPREYTDTIMSKIECNLPKAAIRPTNFKLELDNALSQARQMPYRQLDLVRKEEEYDEKFDVKGKTEWELLMLMENKLADWQTVRRQSVFKTRTKLKPKPFLHPTIYSSNTDFLNTQLEKKPSPLQVVPPIELIDLKPADEILEKNRRLVKAGKIHGNKNDFYQFRRKSTVRRAESRRRLSKTKSKTKKDFFKELIDLTQAYDAKEYEPIDFLKKEDEFDQKMISRRVPDYYSFSDGRPIGKRHKSVIKTASKISKMDEPETSKLKTLRKSRTQLTSRPKSKSKVQKEKKKIYSWNIAEASEMSKLSEPQSKNSIHQAIQSERNEKKGRAFDSKAMVSKYKDFLKNYGQIVAKRKVEAEELIKEMEFEKDKSKAKSANPEDPHQGEWLSRLSSLQSWTYDAEFEKKKKLLETTISATDEQKARHQSNASASLLSNKEHYQSRSPSILQSRISQAGWSAPSMDTPRFNAPSITDAQRLSVLPSLKSDLTSTSSKNSNL